MLLASTGDIEPDLTLRNNDNGTSDSTQYIGSLRQGSAKQVIRLMWKQLLDNMTDNVAMLAGHLYSKGKITLNEEHVVLAKTKTNPRDSAAELLMTVERKGWPCLVEFLNGLQMPELKPLHHLTSKMVITMQQCGQLCLFHPYFTRPAYVRFQAWFSIQIEFPWK